MAAVPRVGAAFAATGVVALAVKAFRLPTAEPGPSQSLAAMTPVFVVTAAWICLLYVFFMLQSITAFTEHARLKQAAKARDEKPPSFASVKYGQVPSLAVLATTRTVGNYLEQAFPFLLSLYMHAVLVDVNVAAMCGWIWLFARCYYPLVFRVPFPGVLLSTAPAYGAIIYMLSAAMLAF